MRIKIKGSLTPKLLALHLQKVLAKEGLTEFFGANIYVGREDKIIEINASDLYGEPKEDRAAKMTPSRKKSKPRNSYGSAMAAAQKTSWEPREGVIQPKNLIDISDSEIPF